MINLEIRGFGFLAIGPTAPIGDKSRLIEPGFEYPRWINSLA
jgi:hypothetical protein